MKVAAFLLLLCTTSLTVSGQTDSLHVQSKKAEYLHKSRTQKTVAFVMLGVGTASIITGAIMAGNSNNALPYPFPPTDEKAYEGGTLIFIGILLDLGSIPFFLSAAKNKGRSMSVSLQNEMIPREMITQVKQYSIPALSVKWTF